MSRIKHFEDLSEKDFKFFLNNISEFIVSEKVDGYNLLFGRDEKGFFTSRETRGGKRYYSEKEYPLTYATTYQRSAHMALEYVYCISGAPYLQIGDLFEVEILYGKLPNVVLYEGYCNQCILLRKVQGTTYIDELYWQNNQRWIGFQLQIPLLSKDLSKTLITIEDNWQFEKVSKYCLIPQVFDLNRSRLELKEELLELYVRNQKSQFGPSVEEGGWIEGLVFTHKDNDLIVKLVDKETFTKIKNFTWKVRNSISERPQGANLGHSILGDFWINLGTTIGNPLYGTTHVSRQLKKLGTIDNIIEYFHNFDFQVIRDKWKVFAKMYEEKVNESFENYKKDKKNLVLEIKDKKFSYNGEIDYKTCQTFCETKEYFNIFMQELDNVRNMKDLIFLFLGKYLLR